MPTIPEMTRADGTLAIWPRILLVGLVGLGCVAASVDPFAIALFVVYVAVGALLAIRRPSNIVGWLLIAIAFTFVGTARQPSLDVAGLTRGDASFAQTVTVWIGAWAGSATFLGFASLAAVFPTGRLPGGRWRRPVIAVLGAGLVVVALSMVAPTISVSPDGATSVDVPNPIGLLPGAPFWSVAPLLGLAIVVAAFATAVASMLTRYRRAGATERLQLRWLLAAIAFLLLAVLFGIATIMFAGDQIGVVAWIPAIVAFPTIPAAIGVAVLRYRLYEIDRIVNRALVYGAVTAILGGVFAAATTLSQRLLVTATGQSSDATVVLMTLVIVTLYSPIRKRVEAVVDRHFRYDQRRYGPYRDQLQRLLELVDPVPAAARLAREALADMQAIGVAVTDRAGTPVGIAGTWPTGQLTAVRIGDETAPLVEVLLGPRRDGRPHDPAGLAAVADVGTIAVATLRPGQGHHGNEVRSPQTGAAEAPPFDRAIEVAPDGDLRTAEPT